MSTDEIRHRQLAQAVEALRRARKQPVGPHRNDLRQLARSLRRLAQQGYFGDRPTPPLLDGINFDSRDDVDTLRGKAEQAVHAAQGLPECRERSDLMRAAKAFEALARERAWLEGHPDRNEGASSPDASPEPMRIKPVLPARNPG